MTETNEKKRTVVLTALIVVSVFAMIVTFSGAATAADINRGNSSSDDRWDTAAGDGVVGENATVFQGEADLNFTKVGTVVDANPNYFERTTGSNQGATLEVPVPTDQPTGSYTHIQADFDLTVATPRIQTLEIRNDQSGDGADISGGTATNDSLQVYVQYNYGQAEDITLTVEDSNGVDVTNEVSGTTVASAATGIADQPDQTSGVSDSVTMNIDVSNLDEGEHTFIVEGVDDLTSGNASASSTVTINRTTDDAPTGELTFSDQRIDGRTVTVENVSTDQNSTVVLTWTRDGNLYSAGIENADNLDGENVTVTLQMPNAYPGNLTAWVFADEDVPAPPLGIGFLTTIENADEVMAPALDSETAYVDAPTGRMTFTDQELSEGAVLVENVSTGQESTILLTYFENGKQVIAGMASADSLDGQNVTVDIQDRGGIPGEHNAWLLADRDLPEDLGVGDDALPVIDSEMADGDAWIATDCRTVVTAVAGDDEVADVELLTAIRYWRTDATVPGTCGETVEHGDLLDMIELWRR